jgi:beta-glucosidase/6-phospho-beta-glucosidase/beta-galactosidase
VLQAISEDGVDVMGAFMWSWVNNWEWGIFDHQFGLQFMNETTQERIFNRSFFDIVNFVETRRL